MPKVCVVTGGAGFIGSHLARRLVENGSRVRVIDNLVSGNLENLKGIEDSIVFLCGDIRDLRFLRTVFIGAEVVFHQAALTSVPESIENPLLVNEVNITGTVNVLTAAKECGVKRVVIASSSAVYGNSQILPKSEDLTPEPVSPYAITKLAGEMYSKFFSQFSGVETVCLRYFNVYGPRQNPNSEYAAVIPRFISRMLHGKRPIVYGDGEQSRDFVYIDDVVEANLLAASADGVAGECFNIASGVSFSLNELVELINRLLGTRLRPKYESPRVGDVKHSCASIEKARKLLGYAPTTSLEQGLRATIEWYKVQLRCRQPKAAGEGDI